MSSVITFTFEIMNIPGFASQIFSQQYEIAMSFIDALKDFVKKYLSGKSVADLAVISEIRGILDTDDVMKPVSTIVQEFGAHLKITLRSLVNGPNLLSQVYASSISDDQIVEALEDVKRIVSSEKQDEVAVKSKIDKIEKEILEKEEEPEESDEFEEFNIPSPNIRLKDEEGISPPPAPGSVPTSGSGHPKPPQMSPAAPPPMPSPAKEMIKESDEISRKVKKKAKKDHAKGKKTASLRTETRSLELMEETILEEEVLLDSNIIEEGKSAHTYEKSCAVDYFDVMNPEKYYPLIITISDIIQEKRAKVENLLTGERLARKTDEMTLELEESIVKVRPIFPGCSVTPYEMYTDLEHPKDKLTFYITPLVSDEIKESRIEIVDSNENVVFHIGCPCEVKDPRYSRVVALYGILASSLPKILTVFGIDAVNELDIADILPFLLNTFGDVSLGNFIGVAGIAISLIIAGIVYLTRGEKSTRKSFKLSDIRNLDKKPRLRLRRES